MVSTSWMCMAVSLSFTHFNVRKVSEGKKRNQKSFLSILYFFRIWNYTTEFHPGWIRTRNLLIFGQTPKLSYILVWQEDSCSPKLSVYKVRWIVSIVQALRMIDAQDDFLFFKSETIEFDPCGIWTYKFLIIYSFYRTKSKWRKQRDQK